MTANNATAPLPCDVGRQVESLAAESLVVHQLVQLRVRAGFTQSELAKKIGCTQSRISKVEASRDEEIPLGVIRDYVKATNAQGDSQSPAKNL